MISKQLRDLSKPHETLVQTLARVHHEAYLIETLGLKDSGVSSLQFLRLVQAGVLKADTKAPLPNAFEVVVRAAERFADMSNEERTAAKGWSANTWRKHLSSPELARRPPSDGPETIILPGGLPEKRWGHKPVEDLQHEVTALFRQDAPVVQHQGTSLSGYQRDAYTAALDRAGMYCVRLGEVAGSELQATFSEDVLRGRLKTLRATVAKGIREGWTKAQLAQELQAVGGWERDWRRVAETELQGAYNDAAVLAAIKQQGVDARVARIPETTACHDCRRLFLEGDVPKVFRVVELMRNGTNVDTPKAQWKATIWPIHPRCRCGCVPVPPGHHVDRSGNVLPDKVS